MEQLQFKKANIDLHAKTCISFREDSFVVSFGNADRFYEADGLGAERYIDRLRAKISNDENSVVHVWLNDLIGGQIELGSLKDDPSIGYVNLYYLIPEIRGRGFAAQLDKHAMSYFRNLGFSAVRLSVSPTNAPALAYCKKMGWVDLGPRPEHPEVHFMEKSI